MKTIFKYESKKTLIEIAKFATEETLYFRFYAKEIKPEYLFKDIYWDAFDCFEELMDIAGYVLFTHQMSGEQEKVLKSLLANHFNVDSETVWEEGVKYISRIAQTKILAKEKNYVVYEYNNKYFVDEGINGIFQGTKEEVNDYISSAA